jgi:ketosteroid isomerase-like protein
MREGTMSEQENRRIVELIQARQGGILEELERHDLIADDIEWWAAGPPDLLPWAGTFRGQEGIRRWFEALRGAVEYDRFEPLQLIAQEDSVVEVIRGAGHARATGRRYESDIVRIWTIRDGKVVRVRSFYDTHTYVSALHEA